jgi:adenylate cyclase
MALSSSFAAWSTPCGAPSKSMAERNAGLPPQRRIDFRIGAHFGDVAEEADGDLMGDGVNVARVSKAFASQAASACPSKRIGW